MCGYSVHSSGHGNENKLSRNNHKNNAHIQKNIWTLIHLLLHFKEFLQKRNPYGVKERWCRWESLSMHFNLTRNIFEIDDTECTIDIKNASERDGVGVREWIECKQQTDWDSKNICFCESLECAYGIFCFFLKINLWVRFGSWMKFDRLAIFRFVRVAQMSSRWYTYVVISTIRLH